MPLLKFRCTGCGALFEDLVSPSQIDQVTCDLCGEKAERAYEGKCHFGSLGSGGGGGCSGNCATCSGCGSKQSSGCGRH